MDALVIVTNTVVMSGVGLALWWLFRGRFQGLEARMDRMDERLEMRMDRLESSVEGLRSDLTAVALAVGARPHARGR
jgi:hypothetical protein